MMNQIIDFLLPVVVILSLSLASLLIGGLLVMLVLDIVKTIKGGDNG